MQAVQRKPGSKIGGRIGLAVFTFLFVFMIVAPFVWLLLAAFSALPLGKKWFDRFADRKWMPIVSLVGGAMLFALCVAALASESYNPFIYFRF